MTTTTDQYVAGYNRGREDEAKFRQLDAAMEARPLFKTPDITPAQIVAIVGACIAVAGAFGFDVSQDQKDAILQLATVLSSALVVGDAVVRHGRATGNAKRGDE